MSCILTDDITYDINTSKRTQNKGMETRHVPRVTLLWMISMPAVSVQLTLLPFSVMFYYLCAFYFLFIFCCSNTTLQCPTTSCRSLIWTFSTLMGVLYVLGPWCRQLTSSFPAALARYRRVAVCGRRTTWRLGLWSCCSWSHGDGAISWFAAGHCRPREIPRSGVLGGNCHPRSSQSSERRW